MNADQPSLRQIQIIACFATVALLGGILFYRPTAAWIVGALAGSITGILNFRFLSRFIQKTVVASNEAPLHWGGLFVLKMVVLLGLVAFLLLVMHVNPIALVAGFSTIIIGIMGQTLRSMI